MDVATVGRDCPTNSKKTYFATKWSDRDVQQQRLINQSQCS